MKTIIEKVDYNQIDEQIIEKAGEILKQGGLVAFPTETVYGLGANALDEEAAMKTYTAKGRPSDNPLIVHIADVEALDEIVTHVPEKAKKVIAIELDNRMINILNERFALYSNFEIIHQDVLKVDLKNILIKNMVI